MLKRPVEKFPFRFCVRCRRRIPLGDLCELCEGELRERVGILIHEFKQQRKGSGRCISRDKS